MTSGKALLFRLGVTPRFHPQRAEVVERARTWVSQQGGFGGLASDERVARWKFADMASAMYPDAPREVAILAANFTNWVAAVDDVLEASPARLEEVRAAVASGESDDQTLRSFSRAWRELEVEMTADRPASFAPRVRAALDQFFDGQAWEARRRAAGTLPSLADYVAHRHENGGLPVYLRLLERSVGAADPLGSWQPALDELAGNLTCFAHDLLSAAWDDDSDNPINLVRVVSGANVPPQHDAAWRYFFDEWQRLQTLCASARGHSPAADAYLDGLSPFVSGVFVWMDETERYAPEATTRS
jgi:hypothetical protein